MVILGSRRVIRITFANHFLFPLITDVASRFLPATLSEHVTVSLRLLAWGVCRVAAGDHQTPGLSFQENRRPTGPDSAVPQCFLPRDWDGALGREREVWSQGQVLISRGFPESSEGLRAECRWVSSPSCPGHLAITMATSLPETKIKGRTGWVESVAANSPMEPGRGPGLPGSLGSCPGEREVEKERAASGSTGTGVAPKALQVPAWSRWESPRPQPAMVSGLPVPRGGREQQIHGLSVEISLAVSHWEGRPGVTIHLGCDGAGFWLQEQRGGGGGGGGCQEGWFHRVSAEKPVWSVGSKHHPPRLD